MPPTRIHTGETGPDRRGAPYHHGNLRAALLTTARRLLERNGAESISLREVAREAGVSHNAPYRHFETREALLAGLAAEGFELLAARLRAAQTGVADHDRLRALGEAYIAFAFENQPLYRLMFLVKADRRSSAELADSARRAFTVIEEAMREVVGPQKAELQARAAWGLVHGLVMLFADGLLLADGQSSAPAVIAEALNVFQAGLSRDAG